VAPRRQTHSASRNRLGRTALIAAVVVLVGIAVGLLVAPGHRSPHGDAHPNGTDTVAAAAAAHAGADQSRQMAALPAPAKGFGIPHAQQLHDGALVTRWAPVKQATQARDRPSPTSPVVVGVSTTTPEGTSNLVVVDGEVTKDGVSWVHARLAVLPDDRTGWLPRSALGGWSFVDTRAVVDREQLTLTLYRGAKVVFRAPIGVGKPSTPTPAGQFYVRDRLTAYASPEYGPLAFGTSARSQFETDWPAGGFIGIHGTDQPNLIPGHVSHGCIRLRNAAILKLGKLMPVGTPVTIQ
jgi:lipoprotein-anchoring transpeptidase ErfK/SrfK